MTNEKRIKSILVELEQDYISYGNMHNEDNQGLRIIEDALKKQIPKKPIFDHVREFVGDRVYKCPSCGGPLGVKSFALRQGTIGCSRCLQAIDWSEVDD